MCFRSFFFCFSQKTLSDTDKLHKAHIHSRSAQDAQQCVVSPQVQQRRDCHTDNLGKKCVQSRKIHPSQAVNDQSGHDGRGQRLAQIAYPSGRLTLSEQQEGQQPFHISTQSANANDQKGFCNRYRHLLHPLMLTLRAKKHRHRGHQGW